MEQDLLESLYNILNISKNNSEGKALIIKNEMINKNKIIANNKHNLVLKKIIFKY